jgi:hypothetical protein
MKSYECKIFMGSIQDGSDGPRFFESDVIEAIRVYQSDNLDTKITLRITQTRFFFLHYEEPGFEIAAIQYPRFKTNPQDIKNWMINLCAYLKIAFRQKSISFMDCDTILYMGEPDDNPVA